MRAVNVRTKGEPGFVNGVAYVMIDALGQVISPITSSESLENFKYIPPYSSARSNWLDPQLRMGAGVWVPANFTAADHAFTDSLYACGPQLTP